MLVMQNVVGNNFKAIMVLENIMQMPIKRQSIDENPNAYPMPYPNSKKMMELKTVMELIFFNECHKFCGCKCNPIKNSKKIMPILPVCSMRVGSLMSFKPQGPKIAPKAM